MTDSRTGLDGFLTEVRRTAECDVLTAYLSDPSWPSARSSYVLIGKVGVDPAYEPFMRGPLKPQSMELFSATDDEPTLVLPDVDGADHPFGRSSFSVHHHVRSVVRLSVRLSDVRRRSRTLLRLPPMLEVFLSFRTARSSAELQAVAEEARRCLEEHGASIRKLEELRMLLRPRHLARKQRRLDRIASEFAQSCVFNAPMRELRRHVDRTFHSLSRFLVESCWLPSKSTISYYFCRAWSSTSEEAEDPVLVHSYPESDADELKTIIARNPGAGLVRYVARTKRSVVLDSVADASEEWRCRHLMARHDGFSVTVPLFAGERLLCVMNVESGSAGFSDRSGAFLWRLLPQIERLLANLFAHRAQADILDVREVLRSLNTKPFTPIREAVRGRIQLLERFLKASSVAFVEFRDQRAMPMQIWRGAGAEDAPFAPLEPIRAFLRDDPAIRMVSIQRWGEGDRERRVAAFRLTSTKDGPRVQRTLTTLERTGPLRRELPEGSSDGGLSEDLVFPLWQVSREDPGEKQVRGLLILTKVGTIFSLTPLRVENLTYIADTLSLSIFSIEQVAEKGTFYQWATAGVGPIHDLVHVANLLADSLDDEGYEGDERLGVAKERAEVIKEQLALWYQFAQPQTVVGHRPEEVELLATVETAVRRGMLLVGRKKWPRIDANCGPTRIVVNCGTEVGITAVLSNSLSNSIRWGRGVERVSVRLDRDAGEVSVSVVNHVMREKREAALKEAMGIAQDVHRGRTNAAFAAIVEEGENRGLRGIGTWLASRVTRELLKGRYQLSYGEVPGDKEQIEVVATVVFPAKVVAEGEGRAEEASATA
ncbi:MAG: GAF domain-containing protein [Planctomycetota bacterium JB042]